MYNGKPNYHKRAKNEFVDKLPSEDEPESDEHDLDGFLSDDGEDSRLRKQDARNEKIYQKGNQQNSR